MKQAITIVTTGKSWEKLQNLLEHFQGYQKYPIYIVVNDVQNGLAPHRNFWNKVSDMTNMFMVMENTWELGAIQVMMDETDVDEFFLIQDTMEVIDLNLFWVAFGTLEGKSVSYDETFSHYCGKFRRKILNEMKIPEVRSKVDAIKQEFEFGRAYAALDKTLVIDSKFGDFNLANYEEEKWGRNNIVLVGKYILKYKGTMGEWHTRGEPPNSKGTQPPLHN